jgi:site-specific recombinase XerD
MSEALTLSHAIHVFLHHRQGEQLEVSTVTSYHRWLTRWLHWRQQRGTADQVSQVTIDEVRAFFRYLQDEHVPHQGNPHRPAAETVGLAPNSIASGYRVLRAFWNFLEANGHLHDRQHTFFQRNRVPRPRVPTQVRAIYSEEVIARLWEACASDSPEQQERDRALLLMLAESGMRVAELCALTDRTVDLERRRALVRGKGGRERYGFWHEATATVLARYLEHRRGPWGGPLFRGISSRNNGGPLTPDAIRSWLKRLAERAGVELPAGSPVHSFRHTFARTALNRGIDVAYVSQLLGHSNLETTMRYVRENPEKLQEIHARMK